MKLYYAFINNKLFTKLAEMNEKRIRRKKRPEWMTDIDDPFFIFSRKEYKKSIPSELTNKIKVKEFARSIGVKTPKTLFLFNKDGSIEKGVIPKTGKVVIKSSNGSGFVKIVNSRYINQAFLKDIYKKWYYKSKYFGNLRGETHYKNVQTQLFGEEFLEDNIQDYKIHISKNGVRFMSVSDRAIKAHVKWNNYDEKFNPLINLYYGTESSTISLKDKEIFKELLPLAEKVYGILGRYVRVDFFLVKNKIYIGELTFTSHRGYVLNKAPRKTKGMEDFVNIISDY